MTKIINFYGGPGTGKSTSAALVYARLKQAGVNCELVREYVKDWAWEKRPHSTYDQLYFMGKQIRRESMLYNKVDVVITDSPVMLGVYYSSKYSPQTVADGVEAATRGYYTQARLDGHEHVHVFLKRSKAYNPNGRYQNEEEANAIDAEIKTTLQAMCVPYIECDTEEKDLGVLLVRLNLI